LGIPGGGKAIDYFLMDLVREISETYEYPQTVQYVTVRKYAGHYRYLMVEAKRVLLLFV